MPAHLVPFLGIAKILGVIALLVPGYPRIKEWAYAGLMFDLVGATWAIVASGFPAANWAFMALPILLGIGSYVFYHKKLRLSLANKLAVNQEGNYRNAGINIGDASIA